MEVLPKYKQKASLSTAEAQSGELASQEVAGLLKALEVQGVEGIEDGPALIVQLLDAGALMGEALAELLHEVLIPPPHFDVQSLQAAPCSSQTPVHKKLCLPTRTDSSTYPLPPLPGGRGGGGGAPWVSDAH